MITGTASTDITATPSNVSTVGGTGSFNVANFTASGTAFGPLALDNFHISVTLPAMTSTSGGPTVFNPDLGGAIVAVDNGSVSNASAVIFDFSKTPIVATAPAGSFSTLDLGAGTWAIPFTTTTTLVFLQVPVSMTFGTDLLLGFRSLAPCCSSQ